ncbi:major facilitator superfamily domain-containing protein [Mycena floridula]|nr:major facilitator superfamily domain-containing protein [Mycena floridula]
MVPPSSITSLEDKRRDSAPEDKLNIDEKLSGVSEIDSGEDFPDGGLRAWLVVFGTVCNTFVTFGYVNAWGVFQSYYQQTILRDSSPASIAWIGSIQYALVFLPGLLIGRIFDLGYFKSVLAASSILLVVATLLVAECKVYWQFLLCQGFLIGIACGGIFGPATTVISHWFRKRRGLALGIHATGSSIGGTVIPIVARKLIPVVGFPWTMRILALIVLFFVGLTNLTLKRRLPPTKSNPGLFDLNCLRRPAFAMFCISSFFVFLGIYTLLTYADISAISVGFSDEFSFYFIAIANASSGVGRCAAGVLADIIGPINVMIPLTTIAGILTYIWPFARTDATLITVVVLYGFTSGAYISLLSHPLALFGDTADLGRRLGLLMSIISLGALIGPPISGMINNRTGRFQDVGIYAGTMVLFGIGLMAVSRRLLLGRWKGII